MSTALERLERVLTMVPWLLENPGADLEYLATRFGSTAEEIADDLDILGYCGLPGYGGGDLVEVSLVGGRVTVRMADFFQRPLRLSLREALTLVLAGRALAGVPGIRESAALSSALEKLHALIGPSLDAAQVAVDLTAPGDELLPRLREAIEQRRVVRLEYRSADADHTTERDVEPLAIVGARGAWYLHSRTAGGPRDFRLDRIKSVSVTDVAVSVEGPSDAAEPVYEPAEDDVRVTLDLDAPAWWVIDWAVVDQVDVRGKRRRVHLRARSLEWAARLALSLGTNARVQSPPELRQRVAQLAEHALSRYRN